MDMRQLEAFCAIVELKSFSAAAKQLYISQPTISNHLHNLEKELNVRLMDRTTKTVIPTNEGYRLYEYAKSILRLKKKAIAEFNDEDKPTIQLGASSIPSAYLLPGLVAGYLKIHNDVTFEIKQADSLVVIEQLKNGSIDIGITGSAYADDSLVCRPIYKDEMVLVTPATSRYMTYKNGRTSIKDILKNNPYIDREEGSGTKKRAEMYFETIKFDPDDLKIAARVNDLEAIKRFISCGMGVSILSKMVAADMEKSGNALTFRLGREGVYREYYLIYRKHRELAFAKYIEGQYR